MAHQDRLSMVQRPLNPLNNTRLPSPFMTARELLEEGAQRNRRTRVQMTPIVRSTGVSPLITTPKKRSPICRISAKVLEFPARMRRNVRKCRLCPTWSSAERQEKKAPPIFKATLNLPNVNISEEQRHTLERELTSRCAMPTLPKQLTTAKKRGTFKSMEPLVLPKEVSYA